MANEKRLDLIDRNALLEKQYNSSPLKALQFVEMVVDVRDIEDAPTVDAVEVVHGRLEEYPDRFHVRCTNCRVEFEKVKFPIIRNYCPNCGAKMDGDGNG